MTEVGVMISQVGATRMHHQFNCAPYPSSNMPRDNSPATEDTNPQWTRHFDAMIREAVRLEAACGVKVS